MRLSTQQLEARLNVIQNKATALNHASRNYTANRQGRLDVMNPHAANFNANTAFAAYKVELGLLRPLIKQMEILKRASDELKADPDIRQSLPEDVANVFQQIFQETDAQCSPEKINTFKAKAEQLSKALEAIFSSKASASQGTTSPRALHSQFEATQTRLIESLNTLQSIKTELDTSRQATPEISRLDDSAANRQTKFNALKHDVDLLKKYVAEQEKIIGLTNQLKADFDNMVGTGMPLIDNLAERIPASIQGVESRYNTDEVAKLQQMITEGEQVLSTLSTQTGNTVTASVPALESITPAARPGLVDRFKRLSTTQKVFAGTAMAVPLLVGAIALGAAVAVRSAASIPLSWPLLITRLAGVNFDETNLRNNKFLSTLLGPNVIGALTSTSRKGAAMILANQAAVVAAVIAAPFSLGASVAGIAALTVVIQGGVGLSMIAEADKQLKSWAQSR